MKALIKVNALIFSRPH